MSSPISPRSGEAAIPAQWRPSSLWRALMVAARFAVALVGRLRVTGDIPAQLRGTPVIVASNHIGTFDPIALVAAMRVRRLSPRLLAAAGLFRVPVVGPILRRCGHIPVNRRSASAADALHEAEEALARGALVAMYPEGRIGLDPGGWPERGKTGLARLALKTGATVVPVAQWGAHEVVAYAGPIEMVFSVVRAIFVRPVVRVHFGAPVELADLAADGAHGTAMRATERIMAAIADELVGLRADEPLLPRFVDETRPVSTARSRHEKSRAGR
ncbi:1-acyl-sn-glycerol-3-phosphate acyltransferase [Virgisporangium aliadipatigenens]|uniref:1-acyl-sn-glycerol-3-phosphate acyltransferase n=1 Tax=Virgisporangium aliadipatigenens TaxID=741659 RepID=A0A8J3YJW7_9ACTN|nr:lysophospholipid acyltransferase family protein [Virgisporangium aliadipatigenens]GIJ45622.1 1-acyl-sn-glycerol-3-phosphate acyltransferase [Virgisporangium aliadipatigenens]